MPAIIAFFTSHPAIFGSIYVLVEYFLGKTDLVKSGSVLELVLSGIAKVFEAFGLKKA